MILRDIWFFTLFLTYVLSEDKNDEIQEIIQEEQREELREEFKNPNIVFIVADDLGWADVSFHGSDQILTPNIDVLAYGGVILQQYYTDTQGTPSRSALFTGKYPLRLGTQSASIAPTEDRGVPVTERLLPAYLRELGYSTHLIGKWHIGRSREHYLPTNRGFNSFYGFLGGSVDYLTYNLVENVNSSTCFFGLDMFKDTTPVEDQKGHITDVFTDRAVQLNNENTTNSHPIRVVKAFCSAHFKENAQCNLNCALVSNMNAPLVLRSCTQTEIGSIIVHLRFPKDSDTKAKWIDATGLKDWFPNKNSTICSARFKSEDYSITNKWRRLFPKAFPTVEVWKSETNYTPIMEAQMSQNIAEVLEQTRRRKSEIKIDDILKGEIPGPSTSQKICPTPKRRKINLSPNVSFMDFSKYSRVIREHDTSTPLYLHMSHAAPHTGGGMVNLQPPVGSIAANDHIAHSARRLYAGLVTSLDQSVGNIVATLAEKKMLQNSVIVFVSDNGAPSKGSSKNYGSNFPLRGDKNSPWEGAARSIALVWHPKLTSRINQELFHVTDWLPTLVAAAGGNVTTPIDGINQWQLLTKDEKTKRKDMLITIDDQRGWAAFRDGDFKIVVGELDKETCGYYGAELKAVRKPAPNYETIILESETFRVLKETLNLALDVDDAFIKRKDSHLPAHFIPEQGKESCVPNKAKGCLFNITGDPLETQDLWNSAPEIVKVMTLRLRGLWAELKPRQKPIADLKADPSLRNYVWLPWIDNSEYVKKPHIPVPAFPLPVSKAELKYMIDLNLISFKERILQTIQYMGDSFAKTFGGLLAA